MWREGVISMGPMMIGSPTADGFMTGGVQLVLNLMLAGPHLPYVKYARTVPHRCHSLADTA
jgi:hypothetical protein